MSLTARAATPARQADLEKAKLRPDAEGSELRAESGPPRFEIKDLATDLDRLQAALAMLSDGQRVRLVLPRDATGELAEVRRVLRESNGCSVNELCKRIAEAAGTTFETEKPDSTVKISTPIRYDKLDAKEVRDRLSQIKDAHEQIIAAGGKPPGLLVEEPHPPHFWKALEEAQSATPSMHFDVRGEAALRSLNEARTYAPPAGLEPERAEQVATQAPPEGGLLGGAASERADAEKDREEDLPDPPIPPAEPLSVPANGSEPASCGPAPSGELEESRDRPVSDRKAEVLSISEPDPADERIPSRQIVSEDDPSLDDVGELDESSLSESEHAPEDPAQPPVPAWQSRIVA